jgi:hypothetical protein
MCNHGLRRADLALLALILALTAIKGVLWSVAVPLWQGPDENRHFAAVQFIAERGRLPDAGEIYRDDENVLVGELADVARLWYAPEQRQAFADGWDGPREAEIAALDPSLRTASEREALNTANHLSPLLYLLDALIYRLAYDGSLIARVFAARQLSVAFAVGTVFCVFLIARLIFAEQREMWFTVPVLVSFQPMFTFITSVINTDALHILLYTLLLYLAVRTVVRGWGWGTAAAAGVCTGLGILNKTIVLGALPVLLLAVAWDVWRRRRWGRVLGGLILVGGLALAISGWWMWRSLRINGMLLYVNPVQLGTMPVEHPFYDYALLDYVWHHFRSLVGGVFVSYWADFGWIDTPLAPWVYGLLLALCGLAAIGVVVYLVRARRRLFTCPRTVATCALLASTPAMAAALAYSNYRTWRADGIGWSQLQGRYYLGPLVGAMVGLALGLTVLAPARWRPAVHLGLRWGAVLLSLASLFGTLLPRYYL